ncbi:hypothetical protein Misp01_29280 [Microtetraspora sp. NBRC 13810]|uniref:hypothetical protein n=1 Tax=Microtetraspora sp. NBRC 13810 TaxID=3030990 RepID=UPI0024A4268C|nr:hypothetical protein [Microtetraspora sp. NBRC 13810]GLW07798.1 hypothetical protein Misp01_29280 [Microtetraspora sp. NBRC 13810]
MTYGPDDLRPVDLFDEDSPVLPEQTSDDTDLGWGGWPDPGRDDDTARLLEDRPPHWG